MDQSNSDFRSLVYGEREEAVSRKAAAQKRRRIAESSKKAQEYHSNDRTLPTKDNPPESDDENDREEEDSVKSNDPYIDRAALRRKAEKEGAAAAAQELTFSSTGIDEALGLIPIVQQRNKTTSDLSQEEVQKYFGGSEETTHVVKGLDTTLLARVREEIARVKSLQTLSAGGVVESSIKSPELNLQSERARGIVAPFILKPDEINKRGKMGPNSYFVHPLSKDFEKALDIIHKAAKTTSVQDDRYSISDIWYVYNRKAESSILPAVLYRSRIGGIMNKTETKMSVVVDKDVQERIMTAIQGRSKQIKSNQMENIKLSEKQNLDDENIFDVEDDQFDDTNDDLVKSNNDDLVSTSNGPDEDDLDVLKEIKSKMKSAHGKLVEMDVGDREKKEELLNKLERISQTGLSAEENPFSLKNASLIPLMYKRAAADDNQPRIVKSDVARPGEAISDKIDAEYGVTQVDIDDFIEDESICSARFFKQRRRPKSKAPTEPKPKPK